VTPSLLALGARTSAYLDRGRGMRAEKRAAKAAANTAAAEPAE